MKMAWQKEIENRGPKGLWRQFFGSSWSSYVVTQIYIKYLPLDSYLDPRNGNFRKKCKNLVIFVKKINFWTPRRGPQGPRMKKKILHVFIHSFLGKVKKIWVPSVKYKCFAKRLKIWWANLTPPLPRVK